MSLSNLIDEYNEWKTPYRGEFVNHVPMAQYALYQMTGDLDAVRDFTSYATTLDVDLREREPKPLKDHYSVLGQREAYSAAYDYLKNKSWEEVQDIQRDVLNRYPEAMSSGLFHVMIRLAYAIEGESKDELRRALAYYVTAHKDANAFTRRIQPTGLQQAMSELSRHPETRRILREHDGTGNRLKAMAHSEIYMQEGFVLEKVEGREGAFLSMLSSSYQQTGSIIALHCITGFHAFKVLEPFYENPDEAYDLFVSACINHLLMVDKPIDYSVEPTHLGDAKWDEILKTSSLSRDVHTLKLAYSAYELEETYGFKEQGLKADQQHRLT